MFFNPAKNFSSASRRHLNRNNSIGSITTSFWGYWVGTRLHLTCQHLHSQHSWLARIQFPIHPWTRTEPHDALFRNPTFRTLYGLVTKMDSLAVHYLIPVGAQQNPRYLPHQGFPQNLPTYPHGLRQTQETNVVSYHHPSYNREHH